MTARHWGRPEIIADGLAFGTGAFFGCVSLAIVLLTLQRKDLRIALPMVYVPTAAVIIWYAWRIDPFGAAVPALLILAALCVLAWGVLPTRLGNVRHGCCHRCGYDLEGNVSGRCSECGLRWIDFMREDRINRPWNLLGAMPLGRLLLATAGRKVVWAVVLVLLICFGVRRHTGPRFTEDRFDMIEAGMTRQEVLGILGGPDGIEIVAPDGQTWHYDPGGFVFASYFIEFKGLTVERAVVKTW